MDCNSVLVLPSYIVMVTDGYVIPPIVCLPTMLLYMLEISFFLAASFAAPLDSSNTAMTKAARIPI